MDITVTQKKWDEHIGELIKKLNPAIGADVLRANVENGNITLYEVTSGYNKLGIFLSRVEKLYDGERQLVILHAVAENDIKMPLISVLNPVCDLVAKESGIKSIRIHSDKTGLNKVLEKHGYKYLETTFVKRLG